MNFFLLFFIKKNGFKTKKEKHPTRKGKMAQRGRLLSSDI
jgi:hypothetical protein